jgi:pimeloyl-ACP methyl ester carboxylesterase
MQKTKVFVVVGHDDRVPNYIKNFGAGTIEVETFQVGWRNKVIGRAYAAYYDIVMESFQRKMHEAIDRGYRVVLVGVSAGASFVVNAFCKRPNDIARVINISGRLTMAESARVVPVFKDYKKTKPLFYESVVRSDRIIKNPSDALKEKFVAFVPKYDELVPLTSMYFDGAHIEKLFMVEHLLNIVFAFTIYKKSLLKVIHEDNRVW